MHPALAKTCAAHATAQAPSKVNAVASAMGPARFCKESAEASRMDTRMDLTDKVGSSQARAPASARLAR
jgi:hypothetical protein